MLHRPQGSLATLAAEKLRTAKPGAIQDVTPPNQFVLIMMQAIWNGQVIAESDDTVVVENNHYFPRSSVRDAFLTESATTSYCGWKGDCKYYTLVVEGEENPDAVWYYPAPYEKAVAIRDRVAFWKGVVVKEQSV